ncbi:hypothetical protein [Endozoicomonas arenosclerae]|uniref:hypothetical protein n=1 Tax=Endozoicomonas arenosclerae TaxID=1633495 RepID=UPI000A519B6C|nr:hypothetical protein [Endozoicomonas arenosclerae]
MRRIYLTFCFICMIVALIAALYGYYIIIRMPGTELGIMEFLQKVILKVARFIIG